MPSTPSPPPTPRRPRGRPRIYPLPDPNAPKRRRGRPTKAEAAVIAAERAAAAVGRVSHAPPTNPPAPAPKPPKTPNLPTRTPANLQFAAPGRATMSRYYKYEALFLAQFHDPNKDRRFFSLQGLADRYEYSKRTVRRDIRYLSAFHDLPIEYFPKRRGWGYYELPPRLSGIYMEEGELFIVAASWGALGGRPGSDLNPKVGKCMEKLLNVLGHDLAFDFKTVSERIAFRTSGYQSAINLATFETVISAVLSQHEITFTYGKVTPEPDGTVPGPATRLVQPRCMVCVDHSAWYILADNPAKTDPDEEPHTFALFRMSDVADTGRKFEPSGKPFDIEAILQDSLGIHRGGPKATVELLFDPEVTEYVKEHFWHKTERFGIADDGRLLLTMEVVINPELEGKIRKWTPNVEVINPPELRDTFKKHAAKEYARYH